MVRRLLGRPDARSMFSPQDEAAIADCVAQAEKGTSGEIVPVVVARSGRYARAEGIVAILFALAALTVLWALLQDVSPTEGDWSTGQELKFGLLSIIVTVSVAYFLGTYLSVQIPSLVRPFISHAEKVDEVKRSAAEAFRNFRVGRTVGGTGILIYVSLYERLVTILGDDPISERLDQVDWDEVRDAVLAGLRRGKPADGLRDAIGRAGQLLALHFPVAAGDVNELRNRLYLVS